MGSNSTILQSRQRSVDSGGNIRDLFNICNHYLCGLDLISLILIFLFLFSIRLRQENPQPPPLWFLQVRCPQPEGIRNAPHAQQKIRC
jgi:hypothetical protein